MSEEAGRESEEVRRASEEVGRESEEVGRESEEVLWDSGCIIVFNTGFASKFWFVKCDNEKDDASKTPDDAIDGCDKVETVAAFPSDDAVVEIEELFDISIGVAWKLFSTLQQVWSDEGLLVYQGQPSHTDNQLKQVGNLFKL